MTLKRHRISVLLLSLLLMQAPILMAWSPACSMDDDPIMIQMVDQAHHACHEVDKGTELSDCEGMSCVFCGITVQFQVPSVTHTVSHIIFVAETRIPAPPRPEQPVELRPPKPSFNA
ncbi:MAG: hypothetical protein KZQ93_09645 [Candidatus Thiodiazotropha sp. (ex Monitilora ramsayi)]|nr:hypothetical protein [Candidatus Thiodiazotropha sp. (ex Monitilora ramsayi)]